MTEAPPAVDVRGVIKRYGSGPTEVLALGGIDLRVTAGTFVAIMGPSGSGKSTLLQHIGGLDAPDGGQVCVSGQDLATLDDDSRTRLRRRRIGFVFQSFNLLPVLSAEENVALPLILDGRSEADAHAAARSRLEEVGVAGRATHYPTQLSGGEQQRVAIARALVTEPLLILADEPTGNLDSVSSTQIIALLRRLVDEQGQTVIMVTHDAGHAAMADRIVRLRDGHIASSQELSAGRSVADVLQDLEAE